MRVNAARGRLIESSTVRVAGITTFEEGRESNGGEHCSVVTNENPPLKAREDVRGGVREGNRMERWALGTFAIIMPGTAVVYKFDGFEWGTLKAPKRNELFLRLTRSHVHRMSTFSRLETTLAPAYAAAFCWRTLVAASLPRQPCDQGQGALIQDAFGTEGRN